MRRTALPASIVLGLSLALPLSACSTDGIADGITERVIERAAEEGVDVDLDSEAGEMTIRTDEGTFSMSSDLPADLPSEVPIIDGEILSSASSSASGAAGWVISVQTDQSTPDAAAEIQSALAGAGFTAGEEGQQMLEGAAIVDARQYTNGTYTVIYSAFEGDGGSLVNYVVSIAE